jgi:hypothetical protein
MQSFTHRGTGILETPNGGANVSYLLTVTRTDSAIDGYGHVQSKGVDFGELLLASSPIGLQLEPGGSIKIVLTSAAGERAVFGTTGPLSDWLFR